MSWLRAIVLRILLATFGLLFGAAFGNYVFDLVHYDGFANYATFYGGVAGLSATIIYLTLRAL